MIESKPYLTVEFINTFVSQESIFEHIIGVKVQTTKKFLSPFRNDKSPTCTFAYRSGVLLFRDWSEDKASDAIGCVKRKYNCNLNEALELIYNTFKESFKIVDNETYDRLRQRLQAGSSREKSKKANLEIATKDFSKKDLEYFNQFGITRNTLLKFFVYAVKKAWRNNYVIYEYDDNDPCIAYYFGKDEENKDKVKLYFYNRRDENRFTTNTNRIQGIKQIPNSGELLIITKSMKDVMCLHELGIPSIAPQSESFIFYDYIITELKKRYKKVVLLYDNDSTGIRNATKHAELYGIPCVFYPDNTAKDTSDYYKVFGREQTLNQIQILINGGF